MPHLVKIFEQGLRVLLGSSQVPTDKRRIKNGNTMNVISETTWSTTFGRKAHAFPSVGDYPSPTLTLHAFKNLQVLVIDSHIS